MGRKCGTEHSYDVCVFKQYCTHVCVFDFFLNAAVNLFNLKQTSSVTCNILVFTFFYFPVVVFVHELVFIL